MKRVLAASIVALLAQAPASADTILATFDGGEVAVSDVEREIRFLRRDEVRYRRHVGVSERASWIDWIRRVALREMAQVTAREEGLTEDPEIREQARGEARDWLLETWREDCYGFGFSLPDDATLAAELEVEPRTVPATVRVSHLFLEATTEAENRRARETLLAWSREIADAETFAEYARTRSQSKTAARGGLIGKIRPHTLPAEVEQVLFSLPAGTLSAPIRARGGWHLFFVHENLPQRTASIAPAVNRERARRRREALAECRQRRLASAQTPASNPGSGPMLEVGPWQIPRDIVHRLHSRTDEEEAATIEARYVEDEQLFQLAVAMDWLDADMRRHLDDLEGDVVLGTLMQRRVEAFLEEPSEEVLRAFAASRSRPLHKRKQMRLDLLQAPIPNQGDPIVFLDDLEGLAERLRDREIGFQEASDELPPDGSVTELPLLDIVELAGGHLEPLLFEAIADLPAGSVTAPIQLGRDFYIVAVREVVPGRDRSFEEAREDLHRLWVQERRRELRESIAAAALERFGFRLTPEGEAKLASLSAAAPEAGSEEEVP